MPVKTRVHPDLKAAVVKAAHEHGMTESDYLAALIAEHTGLTDLVPPIQQEALPISA
ncbi:hypothetical protein [Rhodococcus erythropolis]|uniref:hypothetical protein n=1 Tax=Rhodococcus erythropolis TaxID=1833 RepID=UPI0021BE32BE|nr:hypothetical protein [Rhodococcus erythropolis]